MRRQLTGGTVTMQWPRVSVTVDAEFPLDPPTAWSPSQIQAEVVYRALAKARNQFNAPNDFPDEIRVDTAWAESTP